MINLFINYYRDKNSERQKEIDTCLFKNLNNPELNTIVIDSQERLKFSYFFDKINQVSGPSDINIVANSDIYFDQGVLLTQKISENECYALSRWDVKPDGEFHLFDRPDSQDVWVFRGKVKTNMFGDFNMGFRGCDNRLAFELNKVGYKVTNPSKTIKSYHLHNTNIRNYNMSNSYLVPGPYLTVKPSLL